MGQELSEPTGMGKVRQADDPTFVSRWFVLRELYEKYAKGRRMRSLYVFSLKHTLFLQYIN